MYTWDMSAKGHGHIDKLNSEKIIGHDTAIIWHFKSKQQLLHHD